MVFRLNNLNYNIVNLVREIGYRPLKYTSEGQLNCVRAMGGGQDYPRFHIYLKEEKDIITFNVHLDQKKPSYEGSSAHAGEYDGDTVKNEVERIKNIIFRKY